MSSDASQAFLRDLDKKLWTGIVIIGSKFWLQKEFIAALVIYGILDQIIRDNASA
jgi:hypothetical protein